MEWSEKEDQNKRKLDKETLNQNFLKLSCDTDLSSDKIKNFFENETEIDIENIDKFIRNMMNKFEFKPEKNIEIIKELMNHADLNYINSDFNNSNLIMECCEKAEPKLINIFLDSQNYGNKNKNKKKLSTDIDILKVDKNNNNILHYLFNHPFEQDIELNFEKIMNYMSTNNQMNKKNLEILSQENKDGITPLMMLLKNGWYKSLISYFKYFEYKPHINSKNKNNNLHCAIDGGNIKCLKYILSICSNDELNQQNINNLTPINYAKEKKYFFMVELIKQFISNADMKSILLNPKMNTDEIIKLFMERDFKETQKYLLNYKLNQVINYTNINSKITNISYEWNLLLTKKYEILNKGITPEHIFSKFINTKNNKNITNNFQNKKNVITTLLEMAKFFDKYINELTIKDHLDEENPPIDILIYNRILYHYKICDYDSFLKYINLYFTHIYPQKENNFLNNYINLESSDISKYNKTRISFYKYITYVNISFLLAQFFLEKNNDQFGLIIIEELDKFLTDINLDKINKENIKDKEINCDDSTKDYSFIKEDDIFFLDFKNRINTIEYLNKNEILHPLNETLDDSLLFLYLNQIFFLIKFNNSKNDINRRINKLINKNFKDKENEEKDEEDDEDEDNENDYNNNIFDEIYDNNNKINIKNLNKVELILKNFEKNYFDKSKLDKNFEIKLKILYHQIQSYLHYLIGNFNKSIDNINNLKSILDLKKNEQKIFCYNTEGIINLKLKKYSLAKHFFKLGINLFQSIHNDINTSNSIYYNDIIIYKNDYLYKMEFNLGLACFYNNNYFEAFEIFNNLKNIPQMKNNVFLWFRLGLSALNIYLISIRNIKQKQKKFYQNLNKNKIQDDEIDKLSEINYNYDSNSSNSADELIAEYNKEYGIKDDTDIDLDNNISNSNYTIKKIFLEPNHINNKLLDKFNNNNENYEHYNTYYNYKNEDYSNTQYDPDDYLETSIKSFKKVLNIYKSFNYFDEHKKKDDLNGIYNFYTKNIGETKELKALLKNNFSYKKYLIPKALIYSCYLNLLFSYNLKKKYLDIILLIKSIKKENILSNNIKRKIKYYELIALINLNKTQKANELIMEEMDKYGNIDSDSNNDFDCLNLDDFLIEKDFNHKIFLQLGQIFVDYKTEKYKNSYDKLMNLIKNYYNNNEDISKYYYKLMIYILSKQNNTNKIIKLIKYRWNQIQIQNGININKNSDG